MGWILGTVRVGCSGTLPSPHPRHMYSPPAGSLHDARSARANVPELCVIVRRPLVLAPPAPLSRTTRARKPAACLTPSLFSPLPRRPESAPSSSGRAASPPSSPAARGSRLPAAAASRSPTPPWPPPARARARRWARPGRWPRGARPSPARGPREKLPRRVRRVPSLSLGYILARARGPRGARRGWRRCARPPPAHCPSWAGRHTRAAARRAAWPR